MFINIIFSECTVGHSYRWFQDHCTVQPRLTVFPVALRIVL